MRILSLFIASAFVMIASAQTQELSQVSGNCGDHWFKVHFTADLKTKKASITYSGDSGANESFTGTLVRDDGDNSFRINFNEPKKGYMEIDGSDYYHNIYWGAYSPTGLKRDEQGLGMCSVDWERN